MHVKAGEAIGYLGRYDAATIGEEPPYTTRHQIHFELFSTEKPPQFFIDLFFGVSEEQPEITFIEDTSNCDGYFDRDEPSGFFQQFNDDPQEGGDPVTSILKRLKPWDGGKSIIAKHENEWSLASSEKPFFDKLVQKYQDPDFAELIEHEKTRLDDLIWLPDVGSLGITKDTWNWWPIHGANVVNTFSNDVSLTLDPKNMYWPPYNPMTGEDLSEKLRQALEKNHKKAIILTLSDAKATLDDLLNDITSSDVLKMADSIKTDTDYVMAIYRAHDLVKQFGQRGVNAEIFKSKGKEYIAITTKNNSDKILRHVLVNGVRLKVNGHKYRIDNPKVVQLGLTPQSRVAAFKGGAVATFIISAMINTNDLVFDDDYYLVDWFGNVGTDMFKALTAFGVGEAILLLLGVKGIVLGVLIVVLVSIAIDNIFDEHNVSDKVIRGLKNAIN